MRDKRLPKASCIPVGLTLVMGIAVTAVWAQGVSVKPFVHPGVLVSGAQLDFVKAQVKAKGEPFYTEFERAKASEFGDLHYVVKGPPEGGVIDCGSYSRPNNGCSAEDKDGSTAYIQALLWTITGDHAYAQNAILIMNTYAKNLKNYTNKNAPLQAAWGSEKWPRAAEIIRYSDAGWSKDDAKAFGDTLKQVVLPLIEKGSGSNGNWELSMVEAMMGIAVYTDDHALFDHAVQMWRERVPSYFYYAAKDGDKPVPAPRGTANWVTQTVWDARVNGIPQEACRDFGHTSYGIAATMNAAETAHIQGVNLYEDEAPRLMAAMEFVAYYELKNPVPEYVCEGTLKLSEGATFVIGYNEFHRRLGLELPFTKKWIEEDVLKDPFPTDGGGHMILFEPLTHGADVGRK